MPFRTALSGLNAASTQLRVLGNNIANSSTVGFKKSRTEFADVVPAGSLGTASNTVGSGVKVSAITQQFTQGNVNFTDNNLDLANSGQGFFIVSDNGVNSYTRAGNFGVDRQGFVVNTQSQRVQAFQADAAGTITGAINDLQLDRSDIPPSATTSIDAGINLDATSLIPGNLVPTNSFTVPNTTILDGDATTGTTFNSPNFTAVDQYGANQTLNVRFVKLAGADQFDMFLVQGGTTFAAAANPITATAIPTSTTFAWDADGAGSQSATTVTVNTSAITGITAAANGDTTAATAVSAVTGSQQSAFFASDTTTFNNSTSVNVFDSLGSPHLLTTYFRRTGVPNTWEVYGTVDGTAVGGANNLVFSNAGAVVTPAAPSTITLPAYTPPGGAAAMNLSIDVADLSQYGSAFSVNSLVQNGFTTGRLNGIDVGETGIVTASFTNGQTRTLAQVALANFSNPQGLNQLGDTSWAETFGSGAPLISAPGSGSLGLIQSGAEEGSNVDLTEQLVGMITAQRNFQANAQVITTADTITQTIINIR
ncbi:Flagellar hook protein FlgE [hydrothermal vent metagenome]|uniref:Flagellar hook protein FlgE n=1 Tax=hydrothermal vent metagenome TaxID=652676 RepID=A0A3B0XZZ7_9ZZZZ